MATTRPRSKPDAGRWRQVDQALPLRGELVVHVHPLFGRAHVLEGYPVMRCWCDARVELLEYGSIVHHNLVH